MWDTRYAQRALGIESLGESMTAATLAAGTRDAEPTVLLYTPPARGNPYQQLLYGRTLEHDICPVPLLNLDELDGLRWPYRCILHMHWTRSIAQLADDAQGANDRVDDAIRILEGAIARGMILVWTVHNVLPHECRWVEPERRLRQWLCDHAAVVHILTPSTPQLTAEHYSLPTDERLLQVPHPTYAGVYPDHVSQAEARYELGLPPRARVGTLVGSLRAYKGVDVLLDALATLDDSWHFVVAGQPIDNDSALAVEALGDSNARLAVWPRKIAVEEMQLFLRAADVAVLPYREGLNSGACYLAMTFGLPIVAADTGAFRDVIAPDIGRLVDVGDGPALAQALELTYANRVTLRTGVEAAALEHAPSLISERFVQALSCRLPG